MRIQPAVPDEISGMSLPSTRVPALIHDSHMHMTSPTRPTEPSPPQTVSPVRLRRSLVVVMRSSLFLRSMAMPSPLFWLIASLSAIPVTAQDYRPVLTPVAGDPGAAVVLERHANGQMAKRHGTKDGKPHGLWQEWDADGRLQMTLDWRDGKGEGAWTYFHPNGTVRSREWVSGDVWHGPSESWHANGQKASEGLFVRGGKQGPFRYWSEDGTPRGPRTELLAPSTDPVPALADGWPAGFNVWDVSLTHDLETLFVGTGDDEGNNRRIMIRRWQRDSWQSAVLAPFADTTAAEGTPVVSPDGEWVYFSSARHAAREPGNQRRDLYRASRASGWKTVERVTNTPLYGEVALSLARDGRGVLWTDRRRSGEAKMALYEVRLRSGGVAVAPGLRFVADLSTLHRNDASGEAYPVIAPDGSFLLFSNYDVDGRRAKEDAYITTRTTSGWSTPRQLTGGANSPEDDTPSQLLDGGKVLLFKSSRATGARLYRVSLDAVVPRQ